MTDGLIPEDAGFEMRYDCTGFVKHTDIYDAALGMSGTLSALALDRSNQSVTLGTDNSVDIPLKRNSGLLPGKISIEYPLDFQLAIITSVENPIFKRSTNGVISSGNIHNQLVLSPFDILRVGTQDFQVLYFNGGEGEIDRASIRGNMYSCASDFINKNSILYLRNITGSTVFHF